MEVVETVGVGVDDGEYVLAAVSLLVDVFGEVARRVAGKWRKDMRRADAEALEEFRCKLGEAEKLIRKLHELVSFCPFQDVCSETDCLDCRFQAGCNWWKVTRELVVFLRDLVKVMRDVVEEVRL